MAKGGRGNKAIDTIPADLRAKLDALIDVGTPITEIYESFPAVQSAMDLSTLQKYAARRRRERQLEIFRDNKALLDALLELFGDGEERTKAEGIAYAIALKGMLGESKLRGQLGAVDAFLQIRKDRRKTEEHGIKMRLAEAKLKIEKASRTDAATGEKVVDLATVARLMREVDMAA